MCQLSAHNTVEKDILEFIVVEIVTKLTSDRFR